VTTRALYCPVCGRRYQVPTARLNGRDLLVLCGNCEAVFEPSEATADAISSEPPADGAESVLVAHESPAVCNTVGRVVREAGLVPRFVHDGKAALAAFDTGLPDTPRGLVIDVGIPVLHSFDVISALRDRDTLESLPIILLASVFDPTRCKRRPSSLHGADAYLELHHVPDRLPELLLARLAGATPEPRAHRGHMPHEFAVAEALRLGSALDSSSRAHAVARRIVSDIALYNENEILAGISDGDLDAHMSEVFDEGRRIYDETVAPLPHVEGDPYDGAVQELINVIRRRGNL